MAKCERNSCDAHDRERIMEEILGELQAAHAAWRIYNQLFGDAASAQVLAQIAQECFDIIHDALLDSVLLTITRITDEERVSGKETLVVWRLFASDEMKKAKERLKQCMTSLTAFRHNRIAHRNLDAAVGKSNLKPVAISEIGKALATIAEMVNKATNANRRFDKLYSATDGESLLYHLKASLEFERIRRNAESLDDASLRRMVAEGP